jgi:hypothetical protein
MINSEETFKKTRWPKFSTDKQSRRSQVYRNTGAIQAFMVWHLSITGKI